MLRVVATFNAKGFLTFSQRVNLLGKKAWREDAYRGLVDAGRKTKTKVQRAVYRQMAVKPGQYQGYVVRNTTGISSRAALTYTISGSAKGTNVEIYKGLKVLSRSGSAARRFNAGRSILDKGFVRSGVWNAPRTFKRSFAQGGGLFSLIPGDGSARLPKQFWTFGKKVSQPRDGQGRFAKSGKAGYRIRRLYGPALGKELAKDDSLRTFITFGPAELERQVMKRLAKHI